MSAEPPYNQPQQPYQQPQQPAAYQQPTASEPGKGLSIAAIIFAFLIPLVGLILGIVAMVQSKKAGRKNGLALASIIIAIVLMVIGIIIAIITIASLAAVGGNAIDAIDACMSGATTVEVLGQTMSCEEVLATQ